MDYRVYRKRKQQGEYDAEYTRGKADDDSLGIEYSRYILLGRADSSENTYFLGAFQNRYIGDDADHYRGYHERYRNEGDENVGDDVDYRRYRGHQKSYNVGVLKLIDLVDRVVVGLDECLYRVL